LRLQRCIIGAGFEDTEGKKILVKARRTLDSKGEMLIDERRQHVLSLIQRDGRVFVSALSEALGISRITIRKDLDFLESKGLVRRSHGGALAPVSGALFDPFLKEKEHQHSAEKARIAEAAVELVQEGECILLDSGTTTTAIATRLRDFHSLTVITNAINIAALLSGSKVEVVLTGGMLRPNSSSLVGPIAEDMLREIHADILFLGVDGFDLQVGLTTPNFLEARVNRAMVNASTMVVAVCDASKFHRRSLALIVPPTRIHRVITDRGLATADYEALRSSEIEVTLV
jgi:DeoR family transcriptional regulator of aga operon